MGPIPEFIRDYGLRDPDYLGDGVYVAHEGWQLWLLTERDGRVESIALEPRALLDLIAYAERTKLLLRREPAA
jgi:hypothetical protein